MNQNLQNISLRHSFLLTSNFGNFIFVFLFFICFQNIKAQDCTVNAGVDQNLCEATNTFLNGNISGNFSVDPLWTQVSGPIVTIVDPTDPNGDTEITGLTHPEIYSFEISLLCDDGQTARDTIFINNGSIPTANAGLADTLCTSGTIVLNANSPNPGETGVWELLTPVGQFSDVNDPNATFSLDSNDECTSFDEVVLGWTITDDDTQCFYRDTVIITLSRRGWLNGLQFSGGLSDGDSFCGDNFSAYWGCWSSGLVTTSYNIISGPNDPVVDQTGGNQLSWDFSDLSVGTYQIELSVDGLCGLRVDTFSITVEALTAPNADFTTSFPPATYCESEAPDTIFLEATGVLPGETVLWTISSSGGQSPLSYTLYNSTAINAILVFDVPMTEAQKIRMRLTVTSAGGNCSSRRTLNSYKFFPEPLDPVSATDQVVCSGTVIDIGMDEGLFPIHDFSENCACRPTFINGSTMTYLSGPAGSTVQLFSDHNGNLLDDFWQIANLMPGIYEFEYQVNSAPYTICGNDIRTDTFQITVLDPIESANAGTDQVIGCGPTALAGNQLNIGDPVWSFISGPDVAMISDTLDPNASVSGLATPSGQYYFEWSIPTCSDQRDTVLIETTSDCIAPVMLPVHYTDFKGTKEENYIKLEWTTHGEINNAFFDVEKKLNDGRFSKIGTIYGHDNLNISHSYEFNDFSNINSSGVYYYRLKQVDIDGAYQYSKIICVKVGAEGSFSNVLIYPNPLSNGILFVEIYADEIENDLNLELYDMMNKLVFKKSVGLNNTFNANKYEVDLIGLPTGFYNLKVFDEIKYSVTRLVKI